MLCKFFLATADKSFVKKCSCLTFDGTNYRWSANLSDLKDYIKDDLKLEGTLSSPGAETKLFEGINELSLKWYGRRSRKIAIVKDNEEGFLSKILHDQACSQLGSDKTNSAYDHLGMSGTLFDKKESYIQTVEKLVDERLSQTAIKMENVEKVLHDEVKVLLLS